MVAFYFFAANGIKFAANCLKFVDRVTFTKLRIILFFMNCKQENRIDDEDCCKNNLKHY